MSTPLTPTDKKKVIPAFSEQCFLVDFIDVVSGWKGTVVPQHYDNLILTDPNTPNSGLFLNKLLSVANAQEFFDDLPRVVAADLKPNVELFKVVGNKEYRLPLTISRDELAFSETQQDAVSLKSFSWDYLGTQPAEVDYFINCNMVLHFASAAAFFHEMEAPDGQAYSFRDLIVRRRNLKKDDTPIVVKDEHLEFDPKEFRIKVRISYTADVSALTEKFGGDASRAQKFSDFLHASKMELFLSLLKHTFTPQIKHATETSFDLSIDYNGAVESAFLMPKSNILTPPLSGEEQKQIEKSKEKLEALDRAVKRKAGLTDEQADKAFKLTLDKIEDEFGWDDEVDDIEEKVFGEESADNEKKAEDILKYLKDKADIQEETENVIQMEQKKLEAYSRVISKLHAENKIYHIQVQNDHLANWFAARSEFKQLSESQVERLQKKVKNSCDPAVTNDPKSPTTEACKEAQAELNEFWKLKADYGLALRNIDDFLVSEPKAQPDSNSDIDEGKREELVGKLIDEKEAADREEIVEEYKESFVNMESPTDNSELRTIMFFYYGDLVDTVLDYLQSYKKELGLDLWGTSNPDGKIKFLLGNIEYNHPKTNQPRSMNLAKVPISLELWDQWWLDKVIRPQREKYLFKAFLRDSLTSLVKNAFTNRCKIRGQVTNKIKTNIDHIPIRSSDIRITNDIPRATPQPLDRSYYYTYLPKTIQNTGPDDALERSGNDGEIIFIYAPSNKPGYLMGEKQEDSKYGIYHLSAVGGENKPIKSINFSKTDQPFFLEAKAEKAGILDEDIQMSEPYNSSFAAFGHTVWRPGKYVYMYFPLTWFSKNQSMALGLGGYYLMTKVSNNIERTGKRYNWDSQIEAKWETFPNVTGKATSE
jgi:hypothetical protein